MASARSPQDVFSEIERLVGAWCDRRCLKALRAILGGWPLSAGLTDQWGNLLDALEKVRAFSGSELTEDERTQVDRLIHEVGALVCRK
jgi:hypothetical protein